MQHEIRALEALRMFSRPARRWQRGTAAACVAVVAAISAFGFAAASTATASTLTTWNEPAYTKGLDNYWYTQQTRSVDSVYFVCAAAYDNNNAIPGEQHNGGTGGPGSTNCLGNTNGTVATTWALNATTPKYPGHAYKMCFSDYMDYPVIQWKWISTSCQQTILDNSKPVATTGINGSDEYTKNPVVNVRIDYQDSISPPWNGTNGRAANLVCFSQNTTCAPTNYDANCSVPASWTTTTYMTCNATLPSDGKWYACARTSDRAIPDRKDWSNANSNEANVSDASCGWITLDRVGPNVSVSASATTVKVGDLVQFSAQASDAVSGVSGGFAWSWGDNTAGGAGATAAHTFTQAGTYQVAATANDGVGNPGTGVKVITVEAAGGGTTPPPGGGTTTPPPGGGTTTPPPGGGTTPPPGGGTTTPPPGGGTVTGVNGPTQEAAVGGLDIATARTLKLSRKLKALPMALTAEAPGTVSFAFVKGAKIVARGGTRVAGAGTFSYRLKLPKASRLKAGTYSLKVSFTAQGAAKAVTKTIKVRLIGAKKAGRASAAAVRTTATTKH
jgi:plastocyanin